MGSRDIHEKRKFARFPVRQPAICFRYGRLMTMRTLNISLGRLELEAKFDLRVGEPMTFAILRNKTRINCKGKILATEESKNKVQTRLCFAASSDWEYGKLSDYLHAPSWRSFQTGVVGDSPFLALEDDEVWSNERI